jgi:hypothetical protein
MAIATATGSSTATALGVGYIPQIPMKISLYEVPQVVNLVYPVQ